MDVWVLMSGGFDSTACAHYFLQRGDNVEGIFVDFGQSAAYQELLAVQRVAQHFNIPVSILEFRSENHFGTGELIGRNAFLVFAAIMSIRTNSGILSLGIHSGTAYYDCGPVFVDHIQQMVDAYSAGRLALHCPFLHEEKAFIYSYAKAANIPFDITYSCEAGLYPPCGQCLSCEERNAFQACQKPRFDGTR